MATKQTKTSKKTTATKQKAVTKKVTKKKPSAAKKATTSKKKVRTSRGSKKSTKKVNREDLVVALPEQAFWVTNGSTLHTLLELAEELAAMERDVYLHHVTKDRHDFADWVEQVLGDSGCATALRRAKAPKSAHTVVVTHLKRYQL